LIRFSCKDLVSYSTMTVPLPILVPPDCWSTTSYWYFPTPTKDREAMPPRGMSPELYLPTESSAKREGSTDAAATSFPLEKRIFVELALLSQTTFVPLATVTVLGEIPLGVIMIICVLAFSAAWATTEASVVAASVSTTKRAINHLFTNLHPLYRISGLPLTNPLTGGVKDGIVPFSAPSSSPQFSMYFSSHFYDR